MVKKLDQLEKIKTTLEELEVLGRLKDSVEWAVVKRVAQRYVQNVKTISFRLPEDERLQVRHAGLFGQVVGVKHLIQLVEKTNERASKK